METHVNLSSTASFELREALLVYSSDRTGGRSDGMSFVTKHSVKVDGKGVPSLLPGSPIGESDIFALIEQLRGAVSSEFLPTGLLPDIAGELDVSVSQVGLLVTVFAITVVVSTAPLTALTLRFPRKWLMVVALGVLVLANLLCAVAPSYAFLAVARVLGGLAHGVFWSVTGPYSTRLVSTRHLSRAVAVTQAGGSAAFVLGVPLGTALGHALGWRLSFAVTAGVVLLFLILVVVALPPVSHRVPLATGEIAIPARRDRTLPALVIVAATALLINLGQNAFYTYIVPWTTHVGGIAPADRLLPHHHSVAHRTIARVQVEERALDGGRRFDDRHRERNVCYTSRGGHQILLGLLGRQTGQRVHTSFHHHLQVRRC